MEHFISALLSILIPTEEETVPEQNTCKHASCRVNVEPEIILGLSEETLWWLEALGRDSILELSSRCQELR